jgi:ATP dependent DNA ligase-like protein
VSRGVSAQKAGGNRRKDAASRLYRAVSRHWNWKVPTGERWVHEIKFDGYRVQMHLANEGVRILTRRGYDWTARFKKIAADTFLVNAASAIIDGEVVVPAADGTPDFSVLQNELRGKSDKIVMIAFPTSTTTPSRCWTSSSGGPTRSRKAAAATGSPRQPEFWSPASNMDTTFSASNWRKGWGELY